jgi:sulfite exporter TauE/SafE
MASCGPLVISYIAGTKKNILQGLGVYLIFSLSRISTYLILAVSVFFLGRFTVEHLAADYSKYIAIVGGIFIVVVGVLVAFGQHLTLGLINLKRIEKFILKQDTKSMVLFGLITGFLPCAPLIVLLSLISLISRSWFNSLIYSFSFGLGTLISPLVLLVILAGLIPRFLSGYRVLFYRFFNIACGLVIIFLGIQLIRSGV